MFRHLISGLFYGVGLAIILISARTHDVFGIAWGALVFYCVAYENRKGVRP